MALYLKPFIEESLEGTYVTADEMMEVVHYLMDHSVICRNDSPMEQKLYDRFRLIPQEVANFFDLLRMETYHNKDFYSVRLYAPDAEVPYPTRLVDNPTSLMRMTFTKELSSALLVCYALYDSYAKDARLEEDFSAAVAQHEFVTAHMTMLGIELEVGRNKTMLAGIYRTLKHLRAINYHKNFLDSEEYPIYIRPLIMDLVLKQSVDSAMQAISKDSECE